MATYRKRGSRWHVQTRGKGHPCLTRSFDREIDADNWVRKTERQIDVGELSVGDPETLLSLRQRHNAREYKRYAKPLTGTDIFLEDEPGQNNCHGTECRRHYRNN